MGKAGRFFRTGFIPEKMTLSPVDGMFLSRPETCLPGPALSDGGPRPGIPFFLPER
jgi:hypothetical protein